MSRAVIMFTYSVYVADGIGNPGPLPQKFGKLVSLI